MTLAGYEQPTLDAQTQSLTTRPLMVKLIRALKYICPCMK